MASENNLGGSVGLDVTAFKAGVTELTNQMKAIENSFRASAAVMGDWSSSTQGLSSRVSSLQDKLALQRKALDTLNTAYQKTVSEQGAGSKSAQSLAKQMFNMQGKIKGTEGQLKKYQSALQTAQKEEKESTSLSAKLGKAFQNFAKKSKDSTSSVKSHFSDLKSSILGAVAAIGAGLGFKSAIQGIYNLAESASDLVEAQNVVESTFVKSGKAIEAWTDTTAESAGIGKTAATQWSGFMGAMLKSSGITESSSATMSKSLVQLTGDMSSFYNVGTDEMWEKIRSGISGETEPLKQLGINMSVANLSAYAMSQGIKTAYSKMSQAEQTTLRYNYLLSVTKDAQGDFAKTSNDSMANQSRIFKLNIDNMKQTVGATFLPMVNDMFKSLNPLIKEAAPQLAQKAKDVANSIIAHKDEIAQTIKNTVQSVKTFFTFVSQNGPVIKGTILGIGTAFAVWKVASTIGKAVTAIKKFEEAQKAATLAQAALNFVMNLNPIGLVVIAVGVLVATFAILWNNCEGFRNFWIGLWAGIKTAAQAVGSWFGGPFIDFFKGAWSGIQDAFSNVGNWFKSTFDGAKSGIQSTWSNAGSWFSNAGNSIKSAFSSTIEWIKNNWKSLALFLANPIAGAVSLLYNNNPKFKAWADSAMQTIKTGVTAGMNAVKGAFTAAWNGIKNTITAVISGIVNFITTKFSAQIASIKIIFADIQRIFTSAWEIIKNIVLGAVLLIIDLVTGNFTKLKEDAAAIFDSLAMYFQDIWDNISDIFTRVIGIITLTLAQAWSAITTGITAAWGAITTFFATTWTAISTGVKTFWNALPGFFSGLWTTIRSGITNVWNAVLRFFAQLWVNIGNGVRNAWNGFWATINSLNYTIKTGVISVWNSVLAWFRNLPGTLRTIGSNMFTSMKNGVNSTINNVTSAIKTGIGAAIDWIKALPGEAIQWGRDIIDGIVQGIKDAASAVGDAVKGVAQNIRSFLHFSVPDEGPLADFGSWMPDFMAGLAQGIESNKYKVVAAMQGLAADMSIAPAVRPAYADGYPAATGSGAESSVINYTTIINSPAAPTPAAVNRVERQSAQRIALMMRRR